MMDCELLTAAGGNCQGEGSSQRAGSMMALGRRFTDLLVRVKLLTAFDETQCESEEIHSNRRATMGSTRMALRAGT